VEKPLRPRAAKKRTGFSKMNGTSRMRQARQEKRLSEGPKRTVHHNDARCVAFGGSCEEGKGVKRIVS